MGLFSTIKVAMKCRKCSWLGDADVQFKYGNLYNHQCGIGAEITWGKTQVGDPGERRVAVEGIVGCPACDADNFFDIVIENGVIQSIGRKSGKYDYHHGEGDYVVLSGDGTEQ